MVLYETKFSLIELLDSILPIIVLSVGFFLFATKYWLIKDKIGLKILSIVLAIISIVFLVIFILNLFDYFSKHREYNSIINNGTFKTVSGEVEDFKPADINGKGEETFSINGVIFCYAHYEDYVGYHKVSTKDGIIKENGQILTINYVYDKYIKRNVILRISTNTEND